MDTLEKLSWIEQNARVYAILYRNAGVGFQFYEGPDEPLDCRDNTWKQKLKIHRYCPTFQEAVDSEYERLSEAALFAEPVDMIAIAQHYAAWGHPGGE